jgi:hypothetical protein
MTAIEFIDYVPNRLGIDVDDPGPASEAPMICLQVDDSQPVVSLR